MAGASRAMIRNYADDLRLFPTAAKRVSLVALIALYLVIPYLINDEWGSVLALAGVVAIGAIGLNLLTGYTVSRRWAWPRSSAWARSSPAPTTAGRSPPRS